MIRHRLQRVLHVVWIAGLLSAAGSFLQTRPAMAAKEVMIIEMEGPINPGTAMYVERGLKKAAEAQAEYDAKMKDMREADELTGGSGSGEVEVLKTEPDVVVVQNVVMGDEGKLHERTDRKAEVVDKLAGIVNERI